MDATMHFGEFPKGQHESSSVEDWQARVALLQDMVCLLLAKNQSMRAALSVESGREQIRTS